MVEYFGDLKKIPTLLSVYDALLKLEDLKELLLQALYDPKKY